MIKKSLIATILVLAATGGNAASLTVADYTTLNGNSGSFNYWDESYTPAPPAPPNCTTTNNCLLSGGKGDLTDGVIAADNWNVTEAPAGNGPYVGWSLDPTITFNFGSPQTINSATFHLDDANGFGTVGPPSTINITAGAFVGSFPVPDPSSGAPFAFTATLPGVVAGSLSAQLVRSNSWVFLSEVTFDGSPTAAIPEPSTYALMLAGLGLVGWAARRRKVGSARA